MMPQVRPSESRLGLLARLSAPLLMSKFEGMAGSFELC